MQAAPYPRLLSPFRIGPVDVKNRVVLSPHSSHYADVLENERLTAYLTARAAGGVGLIIHEPVVVHPSSWSRRGKILGYDPRNVEHYRSTTSAVHAFGTKIFCQLIHNGMHVDGHTSGMPAWYPSETPRPGTAETAHAMSHDEIRDLVQGFALSARHCVAGGFDGVEIHAAHGYLLQAFLSPATNHRVDEYGGSVAARVRILHEIIDAVREAVGPTIAIGVRLAGDEFQAGGLGAEATVAVAERLARTGIDYLSIVAGSTAAQEHVVPDMSFPRSVNAPLAAGIRRAVTPLPVLVTGRIADPDDAEAVLASGQADLVGLVRALIADPEWVAKASRGGAHGIRPCIYGNDCNAAIGARRSLSCTVNPDAGREYLSTHPVQSPPRRLLVIGGGIAGMEAAVTAAERGDRVTLVEQEQQLGGQLLLAASPSGRSELARITGYLAGRVREGSVDLRLSTSATPALVTELAPDLVIVATGARQLGSRLGLSGVVTTTWEVLSSSSALAAGGHVVLLDEEGGNGWPFWTAADVLSERGFRVTVVVASTTVAVAIVSSTVSGMLRRLAARGVRIATMTEVQAWENGVVTVRNTMTGEVERWPDVDAVVVDPGRSANNELADTLTEQLTGVAKLVTVGDALAPRRIATAIREARHAVLHEAAVPAGWIPE